jgi:hypothetical protein
MLFKGDGMLASQRAAERAGFFAEDDLLPQLRRRQSGLHPADTAPGDEDFLFCRGPIGRLFSSSCPMQD